MKEQLDFINNTAIFVNRIITERSNFREELRESELGRRRIGAWEDIKKYLHGIASSDLDDMRKYEIITDEANKQMNYNYWTVGVCLNAAEQLVDTAVTRVDRYCGENRVFTLEDKKKAYRDLAIRYKDIYADDRMAAVESKLKKMEGI